MVSWTTGTGSKKALEWTREFSEVVYACSIVRLVCYKYCKATQYIIKYCKLITL